MQDAITKLSRMHFIDVECKKIQDKKCKKHLEAYFQENTNNSQFYISII